MADRGFGIAAAVPGKLIAPLAEAAEKAGYSTFWVNDTPGADGLQALRQATEATSAIRLGVGVIPLDRRPAEQIAGTVNSAAIPPERLIIGIGAGGAHAGSLALVEQGIVSLRQSTGCRVAIGALGMKMIELSGRIADGVILNWLTPQWADPSVAAAKAAERGSPIEIIGYVRTALVESREALQIEADRYASIPQYARHFERMGVAAIDTCVFGDDMEIGDGLRRFDGVLDETVVRAITSEQSLESYMAVLRAGSPS